MQMSEKKKAALYDAIREPIMDLRMAAERGDVACMDSRLFNLELRIWREVKEVLKLTE